MKKILACILAVALLTCVFAACGKTEDKGDSSSDLKLALVVAGTFGDRSFYDSSKEGVDRLAKDFGVQVSTIECNNENHATQMKNAADQADVVVCVGWEFYNVEAIAPDVTQAVQANAVDEDALAELGVQNFDAAIVAIGTDIRASILATVLLKEAGVPKILAKAVDDLHARVLYKVGADRVIFPERDMGQRVARSLVAPNILDLMALSDDDQIAELTLPTDWADKTIVELNIRRNFGVSVLGIHRGGKFLTSPGAETMLMAGDVLLVMGKKEAISAVQ